MRKSQKHQAEELVRQMEEAHDQIKKYIWQGNNALAMELLEDCQDGGVTIGRLVESTEGEGHPTVATLEEYCELVYQIHENLADNKDSSFGKIHKQLRQKLIRVSNSIKNDIIIRKEAVFLPYKASMWDSLESVWKAAHEDENCDAYVIPIPYYDKNPDGSFREMHYEGGQYPDYVPITSYEEYDFEGRRPDMIFIHNPYDNFNLVTSVHPFFFSDNLKKFTEKLVYIPYFVLWEVDPENNDAVEGMKHFCTVPGVFNADQVIVQSEDMRQVYIKALTDYTNHICCQKPANLGGSTNLPVEKSSIFQPNDHSENSRKYWEKKILGSGSPKFDKVADTKREDIKIPDEWLKIIKKPDGSWKKIIFYNTSVGALLQHDEKMLAKIKDVLRIFKENKDEAALLWRPHPLIKATMESMRPQLWMEYDRIVRNYIEEGWGIYDDTADLDRAIEISDAYYGDGSSVVQLYLKTGKPVMMQNVEFLTGNHDYERV